MNKSKEFSPEGCVLSLQWDIFCKVIDNWGDVGLAWRMARNLAARGQRVRLFLDDAAAWRWMVGAHESSLKAEKVVNALNAGALTLHAWPTEAQTDRRPDQAADQPADRAADPHVYEPGDVLVEHLGCELPQQVQAAWGQHCRRREATQKAPPVWLNVEHLSAEPQAWRNHGLPSPVLSGPARGCVKWFFYPGFHAQTGGLLREPNLLQGQAGFDRRAWLAQRIGMAQKPADEAVFVALFCYEPRVLKPFLQTLWESQREVHLLVAAGRGQAAVRACCAAEPHLQQGLQGDQQSGQGSQGNPSSTHLPHLHLHFLPLLDQDEFDHLLWACDFNFVRGEDSWVRAHWAGQAFIWQAYEQDDGVHLDKLRAWLNALDAPADLVQASLEWNGLALEKSAEDDDEDDAPTRSWPQGGLDALLQPAWAQWARQTRQRLLQQDDLVGQLLHFAQAKQERSAR